MTDKRRKRRDHIQNITIVLLSISAVLLFAQTQMYNLGSSLSSGYWSFLTSPDSQTDQNTSSQDIPLSAPVQVAVTGPYGRFGSVTLTTTDEAFAPLRSLLEQALGSARTYTACDRKAFLAALQSTSVYCDFRSPLPLTILTELMWTSSEDTDIMAQRLAVTEQDGRVVLYLWDNAETFLCSETALSPENLVDTVDQYELGNAQFAFDASTSQYQDISPFSLFLNNEPDLAILSATASLPATNRLLTALNFNPNTQNRYLDPNGTEVIREGERTLRIRTDGTAVYQSSGDTSLSISAVGESPTSLEAVTGVASLLNAALTSTLGDASIYLERIQQNGSVTTLLFGYQVDGVPIRFSDGQSAAEVTLSGTSVSSMTLRAQQYTATEEPSLLLPLQQALAIAARYGNAELSIGYADSGSGTVSAQWLIHET